MSTIQHLANSPAHLPPTPEVHAPHHTVSVSGSHAIDATAVAAVGQDQTGQTGSSHTVNNHLTQAVQQALNHLSPPSHTATPVVNAAGPDLPVTMQGFIQALIASLHQIGATQLSQQPSSPTSSASAIDATGSRYTTGSVNDVQNLMQQASAVLSSNAVLQQDFQTMMRAAGVHETPSLDRFLHSVSSRMGGQSSTVSAIA